MRWGNTSRGIGTRLHKLYLASHRPLDTVPRLGSVARLGLPSHLGVASPLNPSAGVHHATCLGAAPNRHFQTCSVLKVVPSQPTTITILGEEYTTDKMTNISPRVLSKVGRGLHTKKFHPLNLIQARIRNYFYRSFVNRQGKPLFAVFDNLNPVVTIHQNFDSLLVPENHVSRLPSDSYYVNSSNLLRAHTSAHQEELIKMGFDAFLVVGDVYRRDEIDASHYPIFHQMEGVKLSTEQTLFSNVADPTGLYMFEDGKRTADKQEGHTMDTVKLLEHELKSALTGLTKSLFGKDIESRWTECYFPFTHPSWELEILYHGHWLEVLGCGIMEQKILKNSGATNKVGWAFGLGLERLAMKLYDIPDIRLFWSEDPGFLNQFHVADPETPIRYTPISQYPPCINDLSFWIPDSFTPNDFYDLVRNVGGDVIEQVSLVDEFTHPKKQKTSHCYRITYRHMEKTFSQEEVNLIHHAIEEAATQHLGVEVRNK